MEGIEQIETLRQALTLFVRVGMPARNLSARTRIEYTNDLTDLITYLERQGIVPLGLTPRPISAVLELDEGWQRW